MPAEDRSYDAHMVDTSGRISLRDRTRDDLYQLISSGGDITRPDLIELTGMSRSTINHAVGRLLADGRIVESEVEVKGRGSGSGRPATKLVAVASGAPVGGIDFGHNHIQVAVADSLGRPLGERSLEVDVDLRAQQAMKIAANLLGELVWEHSLSALASVVAGIPGPLDRATGVVKSPTILSGWVELAPAAELQRLVNAPVRVENDAVLGAYGELKRGSGRARSAFLYVKASHGIGASIVIDGKPYRGATGLAGEIGHTKLPGRTESCRCGNRGCLEAVVSVQQIREQIAHTHPTMDPLSIDLREASDEIIGRILNEAGRTLGGVLATLCDLLNPEAVIIGGELGAAAPRFLDGVAASIERHAQPATAAAVEVTPAELGVRAELVGALELAAVAAPR